MNNIRYEYIVDGSDFSHAGEASSDLKRKLKKMQIPPDIVRRVSVALYEGEINMVIHANGGNIVVEIAPSAIRMILKDTGPGIQNIEQAMQEGYTTATSQIQSLGFGAGMGLPNMKKTSDQLDIQTEIGVGTTVSMTVNLPS